jgi:hypothetical protein
MKEVNFMFKNLTKGELVGVIGSAILTGLATLLFNAVELTSAKKEAREIAAGDSEETEEVEE